MQFAGVQLSQDGVVKRLLGGEPITGIVALVDVPLAYQEAITHHEGLAPEAELYGILAHGREDGAALPTQIGIVDIRGFGVITSEASPIAIAPSKAGHSADTAVEGAEAR